MPEGRIRRPRADRTLQVSEGHTAGVMPKMSIPAPSTSHFRGGRDGDQARTSIRALNEFFADLGRLAQAIRAFYDAGCRYLQLDDTAWAMMCDPKECEQSKTRGDDPNKLPAIYARVTSAALEGKPADMAITMHSCRGNFRSTWIAQGGYEFVAETCSEKPISTGIFSRTTAIVQAASSRSATSQRVRSSSCLAWSRRRADASSQKMTSNDGSTKRRNMFRSINCACRRNAVLPRPRKEISSPKRSNGRNCG